MEGIGGVAVATITPFKSGGDEIDYGMIEKHLELIGREGAHGIVPAGTNGEFPSLTLDEKKKVLEVAAAARGNMYMIAGCGSCSLPEVLDLVSFAQDSGADAALVVPPFYFRDAGEDGIISFYRRVLSATSLPIVLYSIPMYSGLAISDRMIESLLDHGNLSGIKDSGGDPARTRELIGRYPQLKIFGGSDSLAGEAVAGGAAGLISGVANAFPGLIRDLWEARGGRGDAAAVGRKVSDVRKVLAAFPWVAATKAALELKGLPESHVRPPLLDLTGKQKEELKAALAELGVV
ncbi:MAG: dihydrodipicolinate synthase family protein [Thermoleophilia bacterium]|nr:dihydrodipicolinate synthase family protein [Thermoleophilia bacterium]